MSRIRIVIAFITVSLALGLLFAILFAVAESPAAQGITNVSIQEIGHIKDAQTQNGSAQVLKRPKGLYVAGNYAYVDSRDDSGMSIIDVSNASNPVEIGYIQDDSQPGGQAHALLGAYGLCVCGSYAYVTAVYDDALSIIDISDPSCPAEVGYIQDKSHPNGTASAFDQPLNVFVSGDYAYVICHGAGDGLSIINISDPSNPTQESYIQDNSHNGTATALHYPDAIWVSDNYAYVITSADDSLSVVNISNASNPIEVGYILDDESPEAGEKAAHCLDLPIGLYISGNYAYVGSRFDSALTVIDISDPANPVEVGYIQDSDPIVDNDETDYPAGEASALWYANGVFVSGNYAYVASYEDAVSVFNISDPTDPREEAYIYDDSNGGSATTLQDANRISVANGYVYVTAYGEDGFSILETSIITYWPGDVNNDGRINCLDITQCELCILYPGLYPKENYPGWDANEDGEGPNAGDILAVEYRILGMWPPWLTPTPTPTPSSSMTATISPTPTQSPTPTASPTSSGESFTVTLTESNISVRTPTQNSNFYALGRHWVFYAANSSTICYRTSTDGGETWSDSYIVPTEATVWAMGAMFDVLADADNRLHIASAVWDGNLSYISGLLNADGTISWTEVNGSAVQLVWQHPGQQLADATVAVDTDGYPWISVTRFNGIKTVNVFKSSAKNGTWTEERADELYSGGVMLSKIMALPGGEMYCLWTGYNLSVVGRLWNGSDWEAEETGAVCGTTHFFSPHSEVVVGPDIHMVYTRNVTYELAYVVRDGDTGWSDEQVLYDGVNYQLTPALSIGGEYLCLFWLDDTGGNKVLYRLLKDGEWGGAATLTTEAVQFTGVAHIQSADDLHISGNEFEGILYSVGDYYGPPPYIVKFAKFTVVTPTPTPTASPSPTPSTTPEGQGFTVTETSSYRSVRTPAQRSNFYASGRHWVFYETEIEIYYRSSATGQNWSSPTLVEVEECPFKYGAMFDVWEDAGYVHFVFAPLKGGTPAGNISYMRGELNSSGNISWDPVQIVYSCPSSHRIGDPVITVSGEGYPFIAASIYYHNGTTSNVTVFKSSTSNGTWTEEWAVNISSGAGILLPSLTPLQNGSVLCTYYSASAEGDTVKSRLWNGSSWESEQVCTDEGIPRYSFSSYSVVAINDTVHLVYLGNISFNLSYVSRDPVSGWGSEELIYYNSSSWQTAPALSRLGDDVYCFWLDDSGGGWVFYKVLSNGSWDDRVNWILEDLPFTLNYTIQSSYDLTGDIGGVLYQVNTSSPYQIKFGHDAF